MQGVLAVITPFAANFQPRYWAFCNGQILSIALNQALFSLLGTTYGGNGTTTFALPDLQGRMPIGYGQGSGLSPISLGQAGGSNIVTLNASNLPGHVHNGNITATIQADGQPGGESTPDGFYNAGITNAYSNTTTANSHMLQPNYTAVINNTGNNQPMSIMSPMLCMYHVICVQGLYPSRN